MIRCIVKPSQVRQGRVTLEPPQVKHLVTVLRLRPGDEFVVVEEGGSAHVAALERLQGRQATARVVRPSPLPPEESWAITLAAAIPRRPGLFDQLVDQATQLGVTAIIPLITARTVVRPEPTRASARQRRWESLAVAAAEQSGRRHVPTVAAPTPWSTLLAHAGTFDLALLPTLVSPPTDLEALLRGHRPQRLLLCIGPEGDFTPAEVRQGIQAGVHPISLGPHVLRCETAAVAALAILGHALRETAPSP